MHSLTSILHQAIAGGEASPTMPAVLRFTSTFHGPEGPLEGYSYRATWRFL